MDRKFGSFVWDIEKGKLNYKKHGVDFATASRVFKDRQREIYVDSKHSIKEERFFCVGRVEGRILTVRFSDVAARSE